MRVLIVEDSVLLREGLGRILAEYGDEVVAALGTAEDLLPTVDASKPDVVIADVRMPPTHTDDGLRAAIHIRATHPEVGILVLSQYVEERYATDLLSFHLAAMHLGLPSARGFTIQTATRTVTLGTPPTVVLHYYR